MTLSFLFILNSKIEVICYAVFLFLFLGIFAGLYLSWPCLLISENLRCLNNIVAKFGDDKISFKAVLEIFPSYLLKAKNKKMSSRIRIVADACFR